MSRNRILSLALLTSFGIAIAYGVHVHGGSALPGGGGHKPPSLQLSPIANAMRSSFKLRFLQPALPMEATSPREHVPYGCHLFAATLPPLLDSYGDGAINDVWAVLKGRVRSDPFNLVALLIFALAVIHTFVSSRFTHLSHYLERRFIEKRLASGAEVKGSEVSFWAEICAFMGEVEIVFGLWCIPLLIAMLSFYDWSTCVTYLNARSYAEPLFIMVIMVIAATRPILKLVEAIISTIARVGGGGARAWWLTLLTLGPLLGSLITEPAAMTICSLILAKQFYARHPKRTFAYATLGLLFTNISVGGVLTAFAAPPVLIVAERWGLGGSYMFFNFGWKAILGVIVANGVYFTTFYRHFDRLTSPPQPIPTVAHSGKKPIPIWVTGVHVGILIWEVFVAHDTIIAIGSFLLFLGFYQATLPHQHPLSLRQPLLVGLFLAGLVIQGGLQGWWIAPLLSKLEAFPLMLLSIGLTAVNDNAEITYLSSLIPNFSEAMRYAVIAGAVTGGGLTVIANAPNLIGVQTFRRYFEDGVSPLGLFLGALVPMVVVGLAFIFL